jgi:alkanesulfonate monooxygenase SsuD/methylene tetrahydromethanopterin reductase-like flavin-dependent oxidoreductase (luciferase family)
VSFRRPVERLEQVIRQVRRLMDGERIVPARSGGATPLRLALRPASRIPIQVAALGPRAVRLAGELADAWVPFLLPLSGLKEGIGLLEEGRASGLPGRPSPEIRTALPVAVSPDPGAARALASWWVSFYLTRMGPLYARTLRDAGFSAAVDAVLAAPASGNPVPEAAGILLDELTVWGDPPVARAALDSWYGAGADMPVIVLPPGRDVEELDYALEALRPRTDKEQP